MARIAPDFLRELAEADARKAALDVKVKAADEAETARLLLRRASWRTASLPRRPRFLIRRWRTAAQRGGPGRS